MLDKSLADRYARALYDTEGSKTVLPEILECMGQFAEAIFRDRQLLKFYTHPTIPAAEKKKTLEGLAGDPEIPQYRDFLHVLLDEGRMQYLGLIHERLTGLYNKSRGLLVVRAVSVVRPSAETLDRIKIAIAKYSGQKVELVSEVDPSVIGGIRLVMGDEVLDATIVHELKELSEFMNG